MMSSIKSIVAGGFISFAIASFAFCGELSPSGWPKAERERVEKLESQVVSPLEKRVIESGGGLVSATVSPIAVYAGIETLKHGGTAADAAATTALAQVATQLGSVVSYAGIFTVVYYDAKSHKVYSMDAGFNSYLEENDPKSIPVSDLGPLMIKSARLTGTEHGRQGPRDALVLSDSWRASRPCTAGLDGFLSETCSIPRSGMPSAASGSRPRSHITLPFAPRSWRALPKASNLCGKQAGTQPGQGRRPLRPDRADENPEGRRGPGLALYVHGPVGSRLRQNRPARRGQSLRARSEAVRTDLERAVQDDGFRPHGVRQWSAAARRVRRFRGAESG